MKRLLRSPELGSGLALIVVFILFSRTLPNFSSIENLRLLAKQAAPLAVVSAGMTLVIALGGIDISVGSLVGVCSMTLGWLLATKGLPIPLACFLAVGLGSLWGCGNGLLISRMKLPPILVTLATYAVARAAASLFNEGGSISDLPPALSHFFDKTQFAGLPVLLWIGLGALVAAGLLLRKTPFGRGILAIGGNRTAAELSGVPVKRIEMLVYAISGGLAGVVGILSTAYKATATPDSGQFLELQAIAAVALGGSSITGGKATLLGTGLGVLTIGALISGIRSSGREDQLAWLLVGVALLFAMEAQGMGKRERS